MGGVRCASSTGRAERRRGVDLPQRTSLGTPLLKPRVLLFHFLEQRDVWIGVLAQRQDILVSLPALGRVARLCRGAGETHACQHSPALICPWVVHQILEIGHGPGRIAQLEAHKAAQVDDFAVGALIGSGHF
ncbi:MAG: hypothetical protein DMG58_00335 [Acidobacteria bacterium]|nr:MAG: hypothetical protein DMG58_00335 [Acidobacteriota bacterium]